jgi:hypothetical protein
MTSEPPYSEHGGSNGGSAGGGRPGAGIAPVRAFVVLVIFVVAAIALVSIGTRASVSGDPTPTATTTPTTAPTHGTVPSTTTTTIAHGSVSVVVANATSTNALAAHYSAILAAQGWAMQTPVDAATTEASSAVYYTAGQQPAAATIAGTLGLKPAAVLPLTASVPVTGVTGVDVVVVIGADLVAQAG